MTSHEVTVTGFAEQKANGSLITPRPKSTLGIIEVKPPITVGAKFGSIILGRESYGVTIEEVASTVDSTVLLAEVGSYGSGQDSRQELINKIAARVKLFANHPSNAMVLMQQNPFTEPLER